MFITSWLHLITLPLLCPKTHNINAPQSHTIGNVSFLVVKKISASRFGVLSGR
jgi:hypothetical protein